MVIWRWLTLRDRLNDKKIIYSFSYQLTTCMTDAQPIVTIFFIKKFDLFTDQLSQYPFSYRPKSVNNTKVQIEDGWSAYTPVSEWSRLLASHGDEWRISYLNRDYSVCSSYPSAIVVPRHIDDTVIVLSATFRDGGRFPVLCYRHEGGVRTRIFIYSLNSNNEHSHH